MDDTKKPGEHSENGDSTQAPPRKESAGDNVPFYAKPMAQKRDTTPKKESPARKSFLMRQAASKGQGFSGGTSSAPRRDFTRGAEAAPKRDFSKRADSAPAHAPSQNRNGSGSTPKRDFSKGADSAPRRDSAPTKSFATRSDAAPRNGSFRRDSSPVRQGQRSYPNRGVDQKQSDFTPVQRRETSLPKREVSPMQPQQGNPVRNSPPFDKKPFPPRDGAPRINSGDRPARPSSFARPAHDNSSGGPARPNSFARPARDNSSGSPTRPSSFARPARDNNSGGPARPNNFTRPAHDNSSDRPARPSSFARPARDNSSGGPARPSSFARPARDNSSGGPARPNNFGRPARPTDFTRPPRPAIPVQRPAENPRMTALNVLQDITRADAYAQLALSTRLRESRLDQRDKDLVTELTYGTLERQITIDYLLDQRLERPDLDSVVRDILRMGVYQLLYLDRVPASAAVDESVKLAHLMDREPFTGLVNGVLRRIAREKDAGELRLPTREQNPTLYLSIAYSLPLWIVERLLAAYGFEETEAIAAYRPGKHPITVRMTPDKLSVSEFEAMMTEKGWQFAKARLPMTYHVFGAGDIGLDQSYQKGIYSVQGEGSILAAMAVSPKRGQTILDACAAPGGKTACLAQMMQGTGRVHAADIHEHRVEMIRSMMKRLWLDTVRPAVRDATKVKEDWVDTMDAVLLDAPCSGLGVMLAKPDVKYRRTPESVASLVALQKELLDACCQYVKPGGVLVYSTCTILPEENSGQVQTFLANHQQFSLDPEGLRAALPEDIGDRIADGMLQLQAHRDGMEGFFIARMRRNAT